MNIDSNVPLYYQLVEIFEAKISEGDWPTGSKIPSERVLSDEYNVSRITIRAAVEELSRVGMLERVQGKGTFVISKNIVQDLGSMYSFTDEMRKQGRISYTNVTDKTVIPANKKIADLLGVPYESKVVYLERIRYSEDHQPLMLEKSYFPHDKYQFMLAENLKDDSLYELLETKYGIQFGQAIEKFKACKLKQSELEKLEIDNEDVNFGLLIRRTSYIENKIECYSTIVTRGDIFEFSIRLGNR